MILLRLASRNLLRNWWRSLLTLMIVAVSLGLLIWTNAMMAGMIRDMIHGATAVSTGQIQVHRESYVHNPNLNAAFSADRILLNQIRNIQNVREVSPRVLFYGLVGNEERSKAVRIRGVDPKLESRVTIVADAVTTGRWLKKDNVSAPHSTEVVLGRELARLLKVKVGDKLPVFAEAANGSLGNELLTVVGIVKTGNKQIDRYTAYVPLGTSRFITALPGKIHELAVRTRNLSTVHPTANRIQSFLRQRGATSSLLARPWQEIKPGLQQMVRAHEVFGWIVYVIVLAVAVLGIFNTQRMSVLERRREFGVMKGIGVTPSRLFLTVMIETVQLVLVGLFVGVLAGVGVSYYHTVAGFDMTPFISTGEFTFMGVTWSETIHFTFDASDVIHPILFVFVIGLLSGLWPALQSARLDPASVIAGRQ